MKVRIEFTEALLGTGIADPEMHQKWIAENSSDAEKVAEEMKNIPSDENFEKAITVFGRNDAGELILWDYQVKGFFKESIKILLDFIEKDIKVGKAKLSKWTAAKVIDNALFINPRQIKVNYEGESNLCTRTLRAQTMQGERIAIATSEEIPAGAWIEIEIDMINDDLIPLVKKALDYGSKKGIGGWRNSGKGRFKWTEVES